MNKHSEHPAGKDLAFVREGAVPLEWSPVVRNISILRRKLKWENDQPELDVNFGDLDSYETEFDSQQCEKIARYLGKHMVDLLRELPPGPESNFAFYSHQWFRSCIGTDEIIKVELVDPSVFTIARDK